MPKKIIAAMVTTGRSDYGLLSPLIHKLIASDKFELRLIVTGMHLSHLHGKTIQLIKKDGVNISDKIKMTSKKDTENAICNSVAIGLQKFSKLFNKMKPDFLIVLGDRYELWSACMAAVIHNIPIVHIHGGEVTIGAIDDPIRHSVTKMAAFHFASTDLYAKRIIQMGENSRHVFNVGAIGLDNINIMELLTCKELSEFTKVDFAKKNIALMTYHPVTLDAYVDAYRQIQELLQALLKTDLFTLITMPNADPGGNLIHQKIANYVEQYPDKFKLIKNLGQKGYLSVMKYARMMIGNSSSGIIESASFKLPVVNIGDRQSGRFRPKNVIDCACSQVDMLKAIERALSADFGKLVSQLENPYGDGHTAGRIMKVLEKIDFNNKIQYLKKGFYDLSS